MTKPVRAVYMDYAATTPVDPRVAHKMSDCLMLDGHFGNPASNSHRYGWEASELVEAAREQVAHLIGADPHEIIWTSGATESDNLAIKGVARASQKNHIVTSSIEHKAVLDTCKFLESQGYEVTFVPPDNDGVIHPDAIARAIKASTCLVSVMHVNNEIGTINDVGEIGSLCADYGVVFHVDAAQSVGKIPIDLNEIPIDLLSISGHKLYGPKGVGALYVRRRADLKLEASIHGGGHERGMRSGTLATHQIVGLGWAAELCSRESLTEYRRLKSLRERLLSHLANIPGTELNGNSSTSFPGIVNLSFAEVEDETLINSLDDIAVSSGSACTSTIVEPSYVLREIGTPRSLAASSIRFSMGRFTTEDDIDYVGDRVAEVVNILRKY